MIGTYLCDHCKKTHQRDIAEARKRVWCQCPSCGYLNRYSTEDHEQIEAAQ